MDGFITMRTRFGPRVSRRARREAANTSATSGNDLEGLDFYVEMKTGDVKEYHVTLRDIGELVEIVSAGGLGDNGRSPIA